MLFISIISAVLMLTGLVFFLGGTIGILRFPDFYTRLHAAGKLDTLGSLLMMGGLALYSLFPFSALSFLTSVKIILTVVFVFIASPTATHAIVDAGVRAGQRPWTGKKGGK